MKQDSYQRFLKSDLYKKYMMREIEGKSLDLPKDEFTGILGSKELKEERKRAAKGKETEEKEKRRRSLLPWRQSMLLQFFVILETVSWNYMYI